VEGVFVHYRWSGFFLVASVLVPVYSCKPQTCIWPFFEIKKSGSITSLVLGWDSNPSCILGLYYKESKILLFFEEIYGSGWTRPCYKKVIKFFMDGLKIEVKPDSIFIVIESWIKIYSSFITPLRLNK
jgi:hypothetical protein